MSFPLPVIAVDSKPEAVSPAAAKPSFAVASVMMSAEAIATIVSMQQWKVHVGVPGRGVRDMTRGRGVCDAMAGTHEHTCETERGQT